MQNKRYRIAYEDEWLIVAEKPAGTLVIATPSKETNTLTDLLNRDLDERKVEANAHPCHRLDRETSGLVIYAKGKKMQGLMMEQFRDKLVKKTYIAFVHGKIGKNSDVIKKPIYNRNKDRLQDAVTKYSVLERHKDFTVLEVEPVTGRTNQIRIHLADIGHPLVGESVFVFRKDFALKFKRTALHAKKLEFTHPVTKKRIVLESDLPEDMKNFLIKG